MKRDGERNLREGEFCDRRLLIRKSRAAGREETLGGGGGRGGGGGEGRRRRRRRRRNEKEKAYVVRAKERSKFLGGLKFKTSKCSVGDIHKKKTPSILSSYYNNIPRRFCS